MNATWRRSETFMCMADGAHVNVWCKVRNEVNGLRPRKDIAPVDEVVYSTNADGSRGRPVMPREFPVGEWRITEFREHPDPTEQHGYLYPVFIRTDAHQLLHVWELDSQGQYARETDEMVDDWRYGLHFSTSAWTRGCIRVATEQEVLQLWRGDFAIGDTLSVTD
jgi:hypothetical protein